MTNRLKRNIIFITLFSIFLLIFNTIVKKQIIIYAESIMAAFMLIVVFTSVQTYGFQPNKNNNLKDKLLIKTSQTLIIYFIVIYLLGLYFGYSKIVFSLKPVSIINNTIAPITTFICLELFRYIITNANKDNKKILIIFNVIIGLLELSITTRTLSFTNFEETYKTFANYLIPISVKQVAFGTLCYYGGFKPAILYRMVMVIYTYLIPIQPNFSETIICMCNIILPLLIIEKTTTVIDEEKNENPYIKNNSSISNIIPAAIAVVLLILISGLTPLGLTAIASNSMYPTFSKGAAVITLKVNNEKLKKGDIISFTSKNKNIIHRIEKIEVVEEETRYYTKGDANTTVDYGYILSNNINSKIIFSIPLLGYPSIIFNEIFS